MAVAYTGITGCVDLTVGQVYDRAGSRWTWVLILSVILVSAALAVILKALDKKAYPKLYQSKPARPAEAESDG